jgi:hypothetical protein
MGQTNYELEARLEAHLRELEKTAGNIDKI